MQGHRSIGPHEAPANQWQSHRSQLGGPETRLRLSVCLRGETGRTWQPHICRAAVILTTASLWSGWPERCEILNVSRIQVISESGGKRVSCCIHVSCQTASSGRRVTRCPSFTAPALVIAPQRASPLPSSCLIFPIPAGLILGPSSRRTPVSGSVGWCSLLPTVAHQIPLLTRKALARLGPDYIRCSTSKPTAEWEHAYLWLVSVWLVTGHHHLQICLKNSTALNHPLPETLSSHYSSCHQDHVLAFMHKLWALNSRLGFKYISFG